MPTEAALLIFLLIGTMLLVFRKAFIEISSLFDWFLGPRFEQSMKRLREHTTTVVGACFVIASIVGLYSDYL